MNEKLLHFENEAGFKALFYHATIAIIVVDQEGIILLANPNTEKLFDYSQSELEGLKVEQLIPDRFVQRHVDYRKEYEANPAPREMARGKNLYAKKKNGEVFPVQISLSSYMMESDRLFVAFITDVTSQQNYTKRLEAEVEKRVQQLQQVREKESSLSHLKTKFISTASQEFRAPLSTILSSASLIEKYIEHEKTDLQRKHVSKIKDAVVSLNETISDFISLEKLERREVSYNPTKFNLKAFMHDILNEVRPNCKVGQQIILISKELDTEVILDMLLFKVVIMTLLFNAIKFSSENQEIEMHVDAFDDIHLTVKDHGIGIPVNDQERIFQRFYRASNVSDTKGTGLGLHIVKSYVKLMNGTILFESKINKGASFFVSIPQGK